MPCLLFLLSLMQGVVFSQKCELIGKLVHESSGEPMAYASAILTSPMDSSLLLGAVTDDSGQFVIKHAKQGNYQLKLSFVGFQSVVLDDIQLQRGVRDLGEIHMQMLAENLEDITVSATKSAFTYKVDRKVIDAASFPGATVGMDLLENIPSLQVDFEGKLTYRGDGTFKVFINGNPTFQGEEKLKQIPADRIDQIEVITNPSAKYDAEGTAGIIHVILKKNHLEGFNISNLVMVNTREGYDWNVSVDKKGDRGGWHLLWKYGYDVRSKYDYERTQEVYQGDETYWTHSNKTRKVGALSSFLVFGFNHDLTEKDYVDVSFFLQPLKCRHDQDEEWTISEQKLTGGIPTGPETHYRMNSVQDMTYSHWGSSFTYKHAFDKKRAHLFSSYLKLTGYLIDMEKDQKDTQFLEGAPNYQGFQNRESDELDILAKIDYKRPLGDKSSMETGLNFESEKIPVIATSNGEYDDEGNFLPSATDPVDQMVDFKQDIFAGYAIFKSRWSKLTYQLSMRVEHTERKSDYSYAVTNERVDVPAHKSFTDFFPSFHALYNLNEATQLSASYSRRINRASYWNLIPMSVYSSPYSSYTGNGSLMPAISDAFEVSYKKSWDKDFVAVEGFFRRTENVIQDYYRPLSGSELETTPENVGTSWSYGVELMGGVDIYPWWNANLSTSLFAYELEVDMERNQKTESQFKVDSRFNNTFRLPHSIMVKWDVHYNSPTVKAQTTRDGYAYSNLAFNKSFKDRAWRVTLSWSNIFNTYKYDFSGRDVGFYEYGHYSSEPYLSCKVVYTFDNQK